MKRARHLPWCVVLLAAQALASPEDFSFIPAPDLALAAIDALPRVRAAQARGNEASARGEALMRGPYGFDLTVMPTARHERGGATYDEWEAQLTHQLRLPRKVALDRELGEVGVDASTLGLADARHAGARDLLALWFGWLRAAGAVELAASQLDLVRSESEAVTRRVAAGDAAALDADRAAAALAQAEGALARAEAERVRAEVALAARFPDLPLPARSPDVPRPDDATEDTDAARAIVDGIVDANHEIGLADALARRQGLAAARADAERWPDPSLGVRVLEETNGAARGVGLVINIPFAGGGARATAEAEQDLAAAMAEEAAAVRDAVRGEARQLATGIPRQWRAWQATERARRAAEAALARMQRAWELGEAGLADLALARRTAQDAQALEWQARLDVHEARLRVEVDSHRLWARHDDHEH